MRRTNIYLDDEQTASLDQLAEQQGVSRAELIRRLIDSALSGEGASRAADLSAIEDSFGAVQDLDFPARGPSDRDGYLTELWRHAQ